MNYAIIAAGEGSRLAEEGVKEPKPLVKLNGVPLIGRLIDIFTRTSNAESISIIINEQQTSTLAYLKQVTSATSVPLNIVVKSTPSSMHSFFELLPHLENKSCCLTTVDTIFNEMDFFAYIRNFIQETELDGLMAVTSFVDDEKPLYVQCDDGMHIKAFRDDQQNNCKYISGGIYCFRPSVFPVLQKCMGEGISRMRNFQRQLLVENLTIKAFPFGKIIDIDHAADIEKAQQYLKEIY